MKLIEKEVDGTSFLILVRECYKVTEDEHVVQTEESK